MPHVIVKRWPGKSEQQKSGLQTPSREMSWRICIMVKNRFLSRWRK